jgi:hypothetical protein
MDIRLWVDKMCIYTNRATINNFEFLRFVPQFSERFDFMYMASSSRRYRYMPFNQQI